MYHFNHVSIEENCSRNITAKMSDNAYVELYHCSITDATKMPQKNKLFHSVLDCIASTPMFLYFAAFIFNFLD